MAPASARRPPSSASAMGLLTALMLVVSASAARSSGSKKVSECPLHTSEVDGSSESSSTGSTKFYAQGLFTCIDAGTVGAEKAIVTDANGAIDVLKVTGAATLSGALTAGSRLTYNTLVATAAGSYSLSGYSVVYVIPDNTAGTYTLGDPSETGHVLSIALLKTGTQTATTIVTYNECIITGNAIAASSQSLWNNMGTTSTNNEYYLVYGYVRGGVSCWVSDDM